MVESTSVGATCLGKEENPVGCRGGKQNLQTFFFLNIITDRKARSVFVCESVRLLVLSLSLSLILHFLALSLLLFTPSSYYTFLLVLNFILVLFFFVIFITLLLLFTFFFFVFLLSLFRKRNLVALLVNEIFMPRQYFL